MRRRKKMERKSRYTVRMEERLNPEIETKLAQTARKAAMAAETPIRRSDSFSQLPANLAAQAGSKKRPALRPSPNSWCAFS
jgi:hypothetical protein